MGCFTRRSLLIVASRRGPRTAVLSVALVALSAAATGADGAAEHQPLGADELLLIYNEAHPPSRELAAYYAEVRGVPRDRLFGVNIPGDAEAMSARRFEHRIRRPVREYLASQGLRDRVRCLVTFYNLPIRVSRISLTPEQQELLDRRRGQFVDALDAFERDVHALEGALSLPREELSARKPSEEDYQRLLQRYLRARPTAWERIHPEPASDEARQERETLTRIIERVEGPAGVLTQLRPETEQAAAQVRRLAEQVQQVQEQARALLERGLDDEAREEAFALIERSNGRIGLLGLLESDINHHRTDETHAAVDSELMLLWWDDYARYRWVMNPLSWRVRSDPGMRQAVRADYWERPVLMTARIDGPTVEIARRIIDQAVAAEREGLRGKVYLDARGIQERTGHGRYDHDLRELAALLQRETPLTVRLDNRPEVFGPGECPETMLYCGWYSLRNYVPAFEFVPGAVGYHLGSFEAVSLRDPDEQGWCKRMLEEGITATIGPVAEPYLHSFPPPSLFFGLLLTGEFTLAECYAYTNDLTSWMQMLIGDPLYRPFATNPMLEVEQIFPGGRPAPPAPAPGTTLPGD